MIEYTAVELDVTTVRVGSGNPVKTSHVNRHFIVNIIVDIIVDESIY